jgi:phospholipase/carboxylesterase
MLEFLSRIPDTAGDGDPVLVLLHGRGSDMHDLQGLAGILSGRTSLVTPQAPHPGHPWGYGPGWAWYRYLGEDRVETGPLRESLAALEDFLDRLPQILGFTPGPLVLGGFSQGGTMSLAYSLTHPGATHGVVVLSGFLLNGEDLGAEPGALCDTPVFWGHGTQDPAVPFRLALEGRGRLQAAGGRLRTGDYPIGHWVSPEEMEDLRDWLSESIPGWDG